MSAVCPGRGKRLVLEPCGPLSLGLGRGLADQQLNVVHVVSPAVQQFHKAQFEKNLQGSFYGADLLASNGGNHLGGVGNVLVKLEPPAVFQGFQIQFQQDIGIENASGALRAVFGPVGAGGEQRTAYNALLRVQPVEQGRFQFLVQRQHRRLKPPAQQGSGNRLDADTFLPIVQRNTVSAVIVTALMHQTPRPPVLVVVHDGDRVRTVLLHAGTSRTRRSYDSSGRNGSPAPGQSAAPGGPPVPAVSGQGAGGW